MSRPLLPLPWHFGSRGARAAPLVYRRRPLPPVKVCRAATGGDAWRPLYDMGPPKPWAAARSPRIMWYVRGHTNREIHMEQWLAKLFDSNLFMPHGHCYLWQPALVSLMVATNAMIGVSYVAISLMLGGLVYKIRDLPFKLIYVAFGTFIISCGLTHFSDVYVIWHPVYWVDAVLRTVTSIASISTALILPPLLPRAVALASAARAAQTRGIALQTAVTDLETMYQRSKQLEELKTQFFASVSHELRTPLTLILGPLERLRRDRAQSSESQQTLHGIERNARLLLRHVNDLLDLSKLEAGKLSPSYSEFDFSTLVRDCAAHFAEASKQRGIDFVVEAPPGVVAQLDADK
ncbi:MAG: HAMP domain-containing histidine kinase, partial [Deltaproteobacteria bacterium]